MSDDTNNTLGRGLEALIPPHDPVKSDARSDHGASNPSTSSGQAAQDGTHNAVLPATTPITPLLRATPSAPSGPVFLHVQSEEDQGERREEKEESNEQDNKESVVKASEVRPEIMVPKEKWKEEALENTRGQDAIFYLDVSTIRPNPHQPRKHFDDAAIKELASSIREFGIIQPIIVSKVVKDAPGGTEVEYELIAGERRLMASKYLGLETIPAIIRNVDFDRERLELAVIENLQRENLNPVEMARAFARLQDEFRMTQREIAVRLGKSRETVANTLRLLDLPTAIQEALEKNQISESHGRLLLAIDDPAVREKMFQELLKTRMTTRELKHRVEMVGKDKAPSEREGLSPELQMMKERLTEELGAPVEIHSNPQSGGKITISFYSPEELKNILERFGAQE